MSNDGNKPMLDETARTAALMGGKKVLGRSIETIGEMRAAVEAGLPKAALEHVVRSITPEPRLQRQLMYKLIPEPTLRRRRRRLGLIESERIERLARIAALAQDIWDNEADAREFMTTPHPLLAGKTPADMTVTDLGARKIEDILRSLAFGLPV
jgi:putative toxin-antitoxin system antitoxin component (TIGR02293 family)